jgi:uncharacterized membrane protein
VSATKAADFLTPSELERVGLAIHNAEMGTSGEIRVHLDDAVVDDVLDHAVVVFEKLGMHNTKLRNGALIYVSVGQHRAAVIGDAGIHAKLPKGFWNDTLALILDHFKEGRYADGLCAGVERLGAQLQAHFPREADDANELDNQVSFS